MESGPVAGEFLMLMTFLVFCGEKGVNLGVLYWIGKPMSNYVSVLL